MSSKPLLSTSTKAVLQLLADGCVHSGQALAMQLGVSRTAVWKHCQKIQSLGLPLEKVVGQGYRLLGGFVPLSEQSIAKALGAEYGQARVACDVFDDIGSTNEYAATIAANCRSGHGHLVVSERQQQGRGRHGRAWVSPYGAGVWMSLVYRFNRPLCEMHGLSLYIGWVVADALEALFGVQVGLKWPNDLWVDDKKLGGILIELSNTTDDQSLAVMGLGLNINTVFNSQQEAIDQPWVTLQQLLERALGQVSLRANPNPLDRNQIIAAIIRRFFETVAEFEQQGFAPFQAKWSQRDVLANRTISVSGGHTLRQGVACGVDSLGVFYFENEAGRHQVNVGDVSLRPVA